MRSSVYATRRKTPTKHHFEKYWGRMNSRRRPPPDASNEGRKVRRPFCLPATTIWRISIYQALLWYVGRSLCGLSCFISQFQQCCQTIRQQKLFMIKPTNNNVDDKEVYKWRVTFPTSWGTVLAKWFPVFGNGQKNVVMSPWNFALPGNSTSFWSSLPSAEKCCNFHPVLNTSVATVDVKNQPLCIFSSLLFCLGIKFTTTITPI